MMAIGFLGYVLPYGQMSLWGFCLSLTCNFYPISLESFNLTENYSYFETISLISVYLDNGKLANRIKSYFRIGPHNKDVLSIIYGTLLGDSHAEFRINGNGTRISFYQEANHEEYLLWLHKKIALYGYCNPKIPTIQSRLVKGGKLRKIIRFHSFTYTSFNAIHDNWYTNGIKKVPYNIEEYLTPICLAVWIMDDGSRVGYGLKLCTNSFTFKDTTRLSLVMNELYGIKSSVQSSGYPNQYHIYIWSDSMLKVRQLVKPYMVSSMLYKLGDVSMKNISI